MFPLPVCLHRKLTSTRGLAQQGSLIAGTRGRPNRAKLEPSRREAPRRHFKLKRNRTTAAPRFPPRSTSEAAPGGGRTRVELAGGAADQKSSANESSSGGAERRRSVKWSTNENGKLLPLVGPVQVHASEGGGGGHDGRPVSPPLLI